MDIVIDIEAPAPMFAQVIEQIKQAVKAGHIMPGDHLPSIRQLANDLELNNKTVAKAYRFLERDAVIQTRGYRGTFVHPDGVKNSTVDLSAWVTTKLSETVNTFKESGVTDSEIRIAFAKVMTDKNL